MSHRLHWTPLAFRRLVPALSSTVMKKKIIKKLTWVLLFFVMGCFGPTMQSPMKIPPQCGNQISPNGKPENERCKIAYEAFWWQCIKEKSGNIDQRCVASCSGSSCATYGCFDGGNDAERQVNKLLKKYGKDRTQRYLTTLSNTKERKEKTKTYFGESN